MDPPANQVVDILQTTDQILNTAGIAMQRVEHRTTPLNRS